MIITQLENQVDIGTAQNIISPKSLRVTHQTEARIGAPNKANNIANFDNLNVRKYHVDIDRIRYPREAASIDHGSNDNLDKYRDLKFFLQRICWRGANKSFHKLDWYEK